MGRPKLLLDDKPDILLDKHSLLRTKDFESAESRDVIRLYNCLGLCTGDGDSDELETRDEEDKLSLEDVREQLEFIEFGADVASFPADSVVELDETDILFAIDLFSLSLEPLIEFSLDSRETFGRLSS